MSKLPRAQELSRSDDGYDAARVEEAFASFADRVRELESVAGELRAELHSLRSERAGARRAAAPLERLEFVDEEWPVEPGLANAGLGPSPDWVASVPAPIVRPVAIPRIALEGAFLLLVALFAGLADLSAAWIIGVMAGAWALVALSEWAAAAKRSRWRLGEVAEPVPVGGEPASESTGPWNLPVVQATAVELPEGSESHTVVTSLPAEAEAVAETDDPETPVVEPTVEPAEVEPPRRRFSLRRRREAESATDPWET